MIREIVGAEAKESRMVFFIIFFLIWISAASYCGFAAYLSTDRTRTVAQRGVAVVAAIYIILCTAFFLLNQEVLSDFYGRFAINGGGLLLLFASFVAWMPPTDSAARLFKSINLLSLIFGLLFFASGQFFLPLLLVRTEDFVVDHLIFAGAFAVVMLGASWLLSRTSKVPKAAKKPAARGLRAAMIATLAFLFALLFYVSVPVQTMIIEHRRDHAMKLFHVAMDLTNVIRLNDEQRQSSGETSIYPAESGAKTRRAYINFLVAQNVLKTSPECLDEIEIGNVGRDDPQSIILLQIKNPQYDIHTMWSGLGTPRYDLLLYFFRKDGREENYPGPKTDPMGAGVDEAVDPPRTPRYLPDD